jgi:hypothetical protein
MKLETKTNCPLNNFEPCKQLECAWFLKIAGTHPNTGEPVEDWGCSMSWLPVLLIDNSRKQHSTTSAIESFRNEMVKNNEVGQRVLLAAAGVPQQAQNMILESK